jgi:ribosomal protein S18 acetylase RimI-like enzyme
MILEEKEHFIEIDIKLSDGTLIGTAEIEPNEKMLERFAIFEPYQNKGYGQQVLSDLIDAYGIRKLWVRSDNKRAIHVYEKAGFSRTKETMFEMCRKSEGAGGFRLRWQKEKAKWDAERIGEE